MINLSPKTTVGARRFPLRPKASLRIVSLLLSKGSSSRKPLPFAITIVLYFFTSSQTAFSLNLTFPASDSSPIRCLPADKTSRAFDVDAQFFLIYAQSIFIINLLDKFQYFLRSLFLMIKGGVPDILIAKYIPDKL
jgi:hypothetical protein